MVETPKVDTFSFFFLQFISFDGKNGKKVSRGTKNLYSVILVPSVQIHALSRSCLP